jgi:transposase
VEDDGDGVILLHRLIEQGDHVPNNLPIDGRSFRRVEVLTGTPRRRHWSDAEKAAIVAESLEPGARTSEIASRHGLHRNQLYDWRRQFRSAAVADAGLVASDFVPVVAENPASSGTTAVEIEIGGATVRVGAGIELGFLGKVLRLLKAMK